MKHVLIHGPQACGKTRNKDGLAKAFGCDEIVDGHLLTQIKRIAASATIKTLFLTCQAPAKRGELADRVDVYAFDDAMRIAGLSS